ncbi:DnaJ domain-containing protein [Tianweitania sp. BSSL-BM11]|uniref:DnaJ domain-containing protein n=1 Tax=Tianweitania aestuarii TaxID=2814886 RepID=A0ABS5RU04_9HYPH|nr:DnaJ domain-containing protein [Tianweitania aestuarii]MBS9720476.1 DnaJ domain-containing protein [Tianweitania aestuarii]
MSVLVVATIAILLLAAAAALFLRMDAGRLARGIPVAGPAVLTGLGVVLLLLGSAVPGGMMVSAAGAWFLVGRRRKKRKPLTGRRSHVRTAALEMQLDHDTGALEGHVLAGSHEGQLLGTLDMDALLIVLKEIRSDRESVRLLEAYLDSRFATWRQHVQPDVHTRARRTPGTSAMSKEEAYKVLGLEATATAADIRHAHRRLMQRLHPDRGGSTFLAARINEAKDVLLSHHN